MDKATLHVGLFYGPSDERASKDPDGLLAEFDQLDAAGKRKQVFALAGIALHQAQCFETDLHHILVLYEGTFGKSTTRAEIDALNADLSLKTMGALMWKVRKLIDIEDDAIRLVEAGLKSRNQLCHGYFYRTAADLITVAGQRRMCEELLQIREALIDAEFVSQVIINTLIKASGVTDEYLHSEFERFVLDAKTRDGE